MDPIAFQVIVAVIIVILLLAIFSIHSRIDKVSQQADQTRRMVNETYGSISRELDSQSDYLKTTNRDLARFMEKEGYTVVEMPEIPRRRLVMTVEEAKNYEPPESENYEF